MQPLLETAGQIAQTQLAPSEQETEQAIKQALSKGVGQAINDLGRQNAFLQSDFKIPLPSELQSAADKARQFGLGNYVDEFEKSINRSAEKAVPAALTILQNSVKKMTLNDVVAIMRGNEQAATQFFRQTTERDIYNRFLPIVTDKTKQVGVTRQYKKLADKVNTIGRLAGVSMPNTMNLDQYVTQKAVDALFVKVGEKEKAIRNNPWGETSDIIKKVFSYYR